MVRRKRSQEPKQVWHAMSRGVRKSPIFLEDGQKAAFMEIMEWAVESTAIDVINFCLMENHYHLLAEATGERLGEFMRLLNAQYARMFNEEVGTNGHLFQGRYRAYPAKSAAWVVNRALYIHLNPVEAGIVSDPLDYRWSSLRSYVGKEPSFPWLKPGKVLSSFGRDPQQQQAGYLEHVRAAARQLTANSVVVRNLVGNGAEASFNPESLGLQASEVLRLLAAVREQMEQEDVGQSKKASYARVLTCFLAREWGTAKGSVLSAVLGCSSSQTYDNVLAGPRLLGSYPRLQEVVGRIQDRFLGFKR